jgi:hypothetical protein
MACQLIVSAQPERLEGVDSPLRPAKQLLAAQADEPLPEAPDLPSGGENFP